MLDPGHGGEDSGAIGRVIIDSGVASYDVHEKNVNLAIAKYVRRYLNQHYEDKFNCYMTRTGDTFISLSDRVIHGILPDLYVSIHCNSFDEVDDTEPGVTGIETFYYWDDAKRFANIVQRDLTNRWANCKNRGIKHGRYYVIRRGIPESVLIECEFIDEKAEFLNQEIVQRDYGIVIGESIGEYFLC